MINKLRIALSQVHVGNNSQKLKNEIRQLLYSLNRSQKITWSVYNNLIKNLIRLSLADELDLRKPHKSIALVNLSTFCMQKN